MKKISYINYSTWKEWDTKEFGEYSRKEHFYFKKILKKFASSIDLNQANVLEIGFGNGAIAGWLRANHPDATWTGTELLAEQVKKARDAGYDAHLRIPQSNVRFNIVVIFDVLEHLTDSEISEIFSEIEALLPPDAIIITRTPNGAGPFGLPNQIGDKTHITPISLSRLSSYLMSWRISEYGDMRPIWEGRPFSAIRNLIQYLMKSVLAALSRFIFAPLPRTYLASNLHLVFKKKN